MVNLFETSKQIILASHSPRRQYFFKQLGIEYILYHDLLLAKEGLISPSSIDVMCGVRTKDDKEERPKSLELPEDYVFRVALGKALDAMQTLEFFNDSNHQTIASVTQTVLDMDRKETLNLSYPVEKYLFKPNTLSPTKYLPEHLPKHLFSGKNKSGLKPPLFVTADTIVALDDEILGKPQDETDALNMLRRMVGRTHRVLTAVCVADLEAEIIYSFTDIAHVHFASWSDNLLKSYIKTGDSMDKAGSYGIQGVGMFLSDGIEGSWDTVAGLPVAKLLELFLYCKAISTF